MPDPTKHNLKSITIMASTALIDETTTDQKATKASFKVADLSLGEWGRKEIRLAEEEMPGLIALREEYATDQPLAGLKVMGSLHMTCLLYTSPSPRD